EIPGLPGAEGGHAPLQEEELLPLGRPEEARSPPPDPVPADLARCLSRGLRAGKASDLVCSSVRSLVGGHNLTAAAFDRWSDQTASGHLLAGEGWETERTRSLSAAPSGAWAAAWATFSTLARTSRRAKRSMSSNFRRPARVHWVQRRPQKVARASEGCHS
ncbi:unnamed protein product, partial [Prorocentrum cordatum]